MHDAPELPPGSSELRLRGSPEGAEASLCLRCNSQHRALVRILTSFTLVSHLVLRCNSSNSFLEQVP